MKSTLETQASHIVKAPKATQGVQALEVSKGLRKNSTILVTLGS